MSRQQGDKNAYFDLIDPLRGFAAISVLVYHVIEETGWKDFPTDYGLLWFKWGWMGTDIFFVISGFVITLSAISILAKNNGNHKASIREFAGRRIRRIAPLHYLSLFLYIILAGSFLKPDFLGNLFSHLLFIHNWFPQYHRAINAPNWTLGAEVQFYILIILIIPYINYKNLKYFIPGSFIIALAWRTLAFYLPDKQSPIATEYVFMGATQLPGMLDFFALGMLIAFFTKSQYFQKLKNSIFLKFCLFAMLVLWWTFSFHIFQANMHDYWLKPYTVIFPRSLLAITFAILILLLCSLNLSPSAKTALAPLSYLGAISYGIYLFHWPILKGIKRLDLHPALKLSLTLAGAITLASLSWHFYEKQFLKSGVRRQCLPSREGIGGIIKK